MALDGPLHNNNCQCFAFGHVNSSRSSKFLSRNVRFPGKSNAVSTRRLGLRLLLLLRNDKQLSPPLADDKRFHHAPAAHAELSFQSKVHKAKVT
jgi:hypothetical protein